MQKNIIGILVGAMSLLLIGALGGIINWFRLMFFNGEGIGPANNSWSGQSDWAFQMILICTLIAIAGVASIIIFTKKNWRRQI